MKRFCDMKPVLIIWAAGALFFPALCFASEEYDPLLYPEAAAAGIANLHFLPAALARRCALVFEQFRQRIFTTAAIAPCPLNRDFLLNAAGFDYVLFIIGDPEKARITAHFQNLFTEIFRRLRQKRKPPRSLIKIKP